MPIKKFYAKSDTTITNAYKGDLSTRALKSNMGLSDSLEVFFIFGQVPNQNALLAEKLEESRILIKFDIDEIRSVYANSMPSNTKFILKMSNAEHPYTLAKNYEVYVYSLSESFTEGNGLDMEDYLDEGGASWNFRDTGSSWTTAGALNLDVNGDITNDLIGDAYFDSGEENLEIDITSHIKKYFDDLGLVDNGFIIAMNQSLTSGVSEQNYYTKKFFSRSSEYFFKRPVIEARSNSYQKNDRGNFYSKNLVYSQEQNRQRLYLYNLISGKLQDFSPPQDKNKLFVKFYSDSALTTLATLDPEANFIEAEDESTGTYYVDVILNQSIDKVYEEWYYAADGDATSENKIIVHSGEIEVKNRTSSTSRLGADYVSNITNMKPSYSSFELARIRIHTRLKDWSPTIYSIASSESNSLKIENIYYKVIRVFDEEEVIPYGIGTNGSNNDHTLASYDAEGNYFDLDMSLLQPGYMYGIKLMYHIDGEIRENDTVFKFRVD